MFDTFGISYVVFDTFDTTATDPTALGRAIADRQFRLTRAIIVGRDELEVITGRKGRRLQQWLTDSRVRPVERGRYVRADIESALSREARGPRVPSRSSNP